MPYDTAETTNEESTPPAQLRGVASAVQKAYANAEGRPITNQHLYRDVAAQLELDLEMFTSGRRAGDDGRPYSIPARTVRWVQQTLKLRGLLEPAGRRGEWQLTPKGKLRLHHVRQDDVLIAFHTRLGIALLADCRNGFAALDEPIHLCISSPPYPLSRHWGRAYPSPKLSDYVDFICAAMEPVVRYLVPGGSIALNLSNDIFMPGTPARSMYLEYLTIALHERLGLSLMDRLIWHNPSKPPGPVAWASLKRYQLNEGYEPVLWLCNDPLKCFADNRRVLQSHTERHLKLIQQGGERHAAFGGDGAHTRYAGAFGNATDGKIPRNVLSISSSCSSQKRYKAAARAFGLPAHGAPFPYKLADFLVRYLSEEGHLVADPFGGSMTTALAAERNGRRWISTEVIAEYARGGALRFTEDDDELWVNPDLDLALNRLIPSSQNVLTP